MPDLNPKTIRAEAERLLALAEKAMPPPWRWKALDHNLYCWTEGELPESRGEQVCEEIGDDATADFIAEARTLAPAVAKAALALLDAHRRAHDRLALAERLASAAEPFARLLCCVTGYADVWPLYDAWSDYDGVEDGCPSCGDVRRLAAALASFTKPPPTPPPAPVPPAAP